MCSSDLLLFAAWASRCAAPSEFQKHSKATPLTTTVSPSATVPQVEAICVVAPHLFVEPGGVRSIALANQLFDQDPEFRARLGKHHRDVEAMFKHWANVWLSDAFTSWNIEAELADIACPILAIQGCDDQYGSLAHIRRIPELVGAGSKPELLEIPACKHSPHLEHRATVLGACSRFMTQRVR